MQYSPAYDALWAVDDLALVFGAACDVEGGAGCVRDGPTCRERRGRVNPNGVAEERAYNHVDAEHRRCSVSQRAWDSASSAEFSRIVMRHRR